MDDVDVKVRCPRCEKDTGLWRNATARTTGCVVVYPDGDCDLSSYDSFEHEPAELDYGYGCAECLWEGDDLEEYDPATQVLGDVDPLRPPHRCLECHAEQPVFSASVLCVSCGVPLRT